MGEEKTGPQLFANVCGEWKPVTPLDATPVLDSAVACAEITSVPTIEPITIRAKLPKYFRCRSRKRLIKLLMANKFDRREAQEIAWICQMSGESYHDAWQAIWPGLMFR